MANDYRTFSEALNDITPAEEKWLTEVLSSGPGNHGSGGSIEALAALCKRLGIEMPLQPAYFPDFLWQMQDGRSVAGGQATRMLWLYAERDFDSSHVAWLAHSFLKRFRPHDWFSMEWAATCTKPRIGCFGGGAAFVTAAGVEYASTAIWVNARRRQHAATLPSDAGKPGTYNERSPYNVLPPGIGD